MRASSELPEEQAELSTIHEQIRSAFPVHGVPRRDDLIGHPCEECFALRDAFAGRRWTDIPTDQVHAHYSDLPLFAPPGYHYYLPAFVLAATDAHRRPDLMILDMVLYSLCPQEKRGFSFAERFSSFSAAQLSALAHWLYHILAYKDVYEPDLTVGAPCFDAYWSSHLQT